MTSRCRGRGFTIVELLVVIGIIALLLGVILSALGGAHRGNLKSRELTAIRQVGVGWNLYSNGQNGMALPGYIEGGDADFGGVGGDGAMAPPWSTSYLLPDGTPVRTYDASPWPWRLLSYLDYSADTVLGHLPDDNNLDHAALIQRASEAAHCPRFGYNALYFGGWWEYDGERTNLKFADEVDPATGRRAPVVTRAIDQCRRPADIVAFATSTQAPKGVYREWADETVGSHFVTPPWVGDTQHWGVPGSIEGDDDDGRIADRTSLGASDGDPFAVEVSGECTEHPFGIGAAFPIARYGPQCTVLFADGHTNGESHSSLADVSKWVSPATDREFRHIPRPDRP